MKTSQKPRIIHYFWARKPPIVSKSSRETSGNWSSRDWRAIQMKIRRVPPPALHPFTLKCGIFFFIVYFYFCFLSFCFASVRKIARGPELQRPAKGLPAARTESKRHTPLQVGTGAGRNGQHAGQGFLGPTGYASDQSNPVLRYFKQILNTRILRTLRVTPRHLNEWILSCPCETPVVETEWVLVNILILFLRHVMTGIYSGNALVSVLQFC